MATISRIIEKGNPDYPSSDGKPMAETQLHWRIMVELTQTLEDRYADNPRVCVGSDLMVCYEEGNKNKHVAPDVFVVFGVDKLPPRLNYIIWEEGKAPDVVIEVTSKTTRKNDEGHKRDLYRDVLKVGEYFLFDPTEDYLKPSLQGYRRIGDEYAPIEPAGGRLSSELLELDLGRVGKELRFFDPETSLILPTRREENERLRLESAERAEQNERLLREVEELRRRLAEGERA